MCQTNHSWVRNFVFRHFLKFALLVFLDIAQDCSLGQWLASTRAETSKKTLGPRLGPSRSKSKPKLSFLG